MIELLKFSLEECPSDMRSCIKNRDGYKLSINPIISRNKIPEEEYENCVGMRLEIIENLLNELYTK